MTAARSAAASMPAILHPRSGQFGSVKERSTESGVFRVMKALQKSLYVYLWIVKTALFV
jgi:hypothetical protein